MKNRENRKMWARTIALLCILAFWSCLLSAQVLADFPLREGGFAAPTGKERPEYVSGEIIVKFKDAAVENQIESINSRYETSVLYTSPYAGFKRIKIPPDKTVAEMVELYGENPLVEYAEPNYIIYAYWTPNDPFYSLQWHLPLMNMPSAWDKVQGGDPGVVVAVLDSGVAYQDYGLYQQAPDLAGTSFVAGYDFVNNDSHPNDDEGHGTHVTGTIAQTTNNNLGVAGVAFNCSIMPVKVLDDNGSGTYQQIADGLYYAVDNRAGVINLSLGGSFDSSTMYNAVQYAYNNGVVLVAATGNDNSAFLSYPAAYDEVIAVGAVDVNKDRAYYSNYGTGMELMAPGGDTSVDLNGDGYVDGVLQQTFLGGVPTNWFYVFWQGTSMATPHVAGLIALLLSGWSASGIENSGTSRIDNIRDILHSTAEDLGAPGYDTVYGYGLIDAAAALVAVASDLTGLIVYPNPVELAKGHTEVTIEGLTEEVTIRIFTLSGELVRKVELPSQYNWSWNLKNEQGEDAARGIYLCVVTNAAGETKRVKFAILK